MTVAPCMRPLLCALAVSAVVHAGVVVFYFGGPGGESRATLSSGPTLQATLTPRVEAVAEVMTAPEPAPVVLEEAPRAEPVAAPQPAPPVEAPQPAPPLPEVEPVASAGEGQAMRVEAEQLHDRSRLGDFYARQLGEFPREIDVGPRLTEKIYATYPPAALAAGREASVAVWVIVNEDGVAEETHVVDSPDDFADAVMMALAGARFTPARNNLQPIRFPIALEFHFALGSAEAAATEVVR